MARGVDCLFKELGLLREVQTDMIRPVVRSRKASTTSCDRPNHSATTRRMKKRMANGPLMRKRLVKDVAALTSLFTRERATGIEPAFSAWEADVLPLNYARVAWSS